jgi:iron(III) transport system permease protein
VLLLVLLPLAALALQAGGDAAIYSEALRRGGDALGRSIGYAAIAASVLTLLGFLLGYLLHTRALPGWQAVDALTLLLLALPATVLGVGLIGLWNHPWSNLIYATPALLIGGYLGKYCALTSRICAAQLQRLPSAMEEAAQVAGAGWPRRVLCIVLPLAHRGVIAAWLVGYIFALRDSTLAMLLHAPGGETLPVRIFTLMANGSPDLIAALCLLLVAATLLPGALLWLLAGGPTARESI